MEKAEEKLNRIIEKGYQLHRELDGVLSIRILRRISDIIATAAEAKDDLRKHESEGEHAGA